MDNSNNITNYHLKNIETQNDVIIDKQSHSDKARDKIATEQANSLETIVSSLKASHKTEIDQNDENIATNKERLRLRRRKRIWDLFVWRQGQVALKKALIVGRNRFKQDQIEQKFQSDKAEIANVKDNEQLVHLRYIDTNIQRLLEHFAGETLDNEEERREVRSRWDKFFAVREQFKAEKYRGLLGGLIFGVSAFLVAVTRDYANFLKPLFIRLKDLVTPIFATMGASIKKAIMPYFLQLTKNLKSIRAAFLLRITPFVNQVDRLGRMFKAIGWIMGKRLPRTQKVITWITRFFTGMGKLLGTKAFEILKGGGKGIFTRFSGFLSRFGMLGERAKGMGRWMGRLLRPLTAVIYGLKALWVGFKAAEGSTLKGKWWKIVDGIVTGIGSFVGDFMGGLLDLIKDGLSWVLDKIGLEGMSDWLDSFSFEAMVKEGLSELVDMIDMLTNIPKAIGAALSAAVSMRGPSAEDAFRMALLGIDPSASNLGEASNTRWVNARDTLARKESELAKHKKEIAEGDTRFGGYLGTKYSREDEVKLLEGEIRRANRTIAEEEAKMKALRPAKAENSEGGILDTLSTANQTFKDMAQNAAASIRDATSSVFQDASVNNNNSGNSVTITPPAHADRTSSRFLGFNPMMAF